MRRLFPLLALGVAACSAFQDDTASSDDGLTEVEQRASGDVHRVKFKSGGSYLAIEVLRDDVVHFEVTATPNSIDPLDGIWTTPMIAKHDWPGSRSFALNGTTIETSALRVAVDGSLCATVTDKKKGVTLTTVCPQRLDQAWKGLSIAKDGTRNVYGLGNYFQDPSTADGDWVGKVWQDVPSGHGNFRRSFGGAAPSTSQFPMMYALGRGKDGYGLFLDHAYKMRWDFTSDTFAVDTWGDQIRGYVMVGDDLPALRRTYMDLVGHPLVPPQRMFGLWVSKFGYESWSEIEGELASLRQDGFPVDGFAMDTQWFGKEFGGDPGQSTMGKLQFEPGRFPSPADHVKSFADRGVHLMTIEESPVADNLAEYTDLKNRGLLARAGCETCDPAFLGSNTWWGKGGYIDWTNPAAGDYWHDLKRQKLVAMGITAHWTDLGEPEGSLYDPGAWYAGFPELGKHGHGDIHNLYGFRWLESIARGYQRSGVEERPFMMARGGAPGIQRFGAGMWSGDIARNMGSLRAQANTQMHHSLAGMDWYGSDCGGFTKPDMGLDAGDQSELYTQWLADSAMTDVPLRPHGWAIGADAQSFAPDKKGHLESNRANVRLRYALVPYTYSLAHRAFRDGEPVHPPLVYRFQDDDRVRTIGNEKMIGDSLLFGMVADYGETERPLYLPSGRWIGWHDSESFQGGDTQPIPTYRDGLFRLPLFARAGAIVPMRVVDASTANLAQRDDRLAMRVFADAAPSSFTLFEDDGSTIAYQRGQVRATAISQQQQGSNVQVTIAPSQGDYAGAPAQREIRIELVVDTAHAAGVKDEDGDLPRCNTLADLEATSRCFVDAGKNLIVARFPARAVSRGARLLFELEPVAPTSSAHFVCADAPTQPGETIVVVGSDPKLGAWDPQKGVPMVPVRYPRWSTIVPDLPANTTVQWKCVRRSDSAVAWGNAQQTIATNAGYAGTSFGSMR